MPSIVDAAIKEREVFLRRYRKVYLKAVAAELGLSDLQDVALRESAAMIEFARELVAPVSPKPGQNRNPKR